MVWVGDKHLVVGYQPAVTIDAAKIGVVQYSLRLAGGVALVVAIVRPYSYYILAREIYRLGDIDYHREITAKMLGKLLAIYEYSALAHNSLEVEEELLALERAVEREVLAIPYHALVVDTSTRLGRKILDAVR